MERTFSIIAYFILSLLALVIIISVTLNVYYNRIASRESTGDLTSPLAEPILEPSPLEETKKFEDLRPNPA